MKRALTLFLGLSLLISVVMAEAPGFKPEELSLSLALKLENGEYKPLYERMNEDTKASLSEEKLKSVWEKIQARFGKWQESLKTTLNLRQGLPVADVYMRHERAILRFRFPYDEKGLLSGFWIQVPTASELLALGLEPLPQKDPVSDFLKKLSELDLDSASRPPQISESPCTIGEYSLPGILTRPRSGALPIACLILAGSGPQDADETLGSAQNKPLRDLAWGLAQEGISSLRYDKRTRARPQSFTAEDGIEEELTTDAMAAAAQMSEMPELKDYKLFLIGHSLGGMLTPYLLNRSPLLSGGILLSGSPRTLIEIIRDQNEAQIKGLKSENDINAARDLLKQEEEKLKAIREGGEGTAYGMPAAYIRSLDRIELTAEALNCAKPLLIVQGDKDRQVDVKRDFEAFKALLDGKKGVTFKLYHNLNHLLMPSQTGDIAEYDLKNHMSPELIKDLALWLKDQP